MAFRYVVKKRVFGFDESKSEKYVATSFSIGEISYDRLCDQVTKEGMAPRGVVKMVMDGLIDALSTYVSLGATVKLGDFGTIRPGLNCKSQSEYIEKAVRFYSGYLDTEHAEEYLPRILSDVLEGKLGAFGKRMGHLLFKQAVDQDLMANLLASDINVGLDTLQKLRVRCVKNVKETNGEIDFQDAFRFQKRIEE